MKWVQGASRQVLCAINSGPSFRLLSFFPKYVDPVVLLGGEDVKVEGGGDLFGTPRPCTSLFVYL